MVSLVRPEWRVAAEDATVCVVLCSLHAASELDRL